MERIGWIGDADARRLHRWREETQTVEALDVYDALHRAGIRFADVYDRPEHAAIAAELEDSPEPVAGRKRGKPVGKYRRMTDQQVRAAHVLYERHQLSFRALGALLWERFGYSSPKSCGNALCEAFISLGLPRRDRIAATVAASWIDGSTTREKRLSNHPDYLARRRQNRRDRGEILDRPLCSGVRTQYPRKGAPCQVRAQAGSDFCMAHDPMRAQERDDHLRAARALLGLAETTQETTHAQ